MIRRFNCNRLSFNLCILHCFKYCFSIFPRNFHKCILIIHINRSYQSSIQTTFSSNRSKNISRFCLAFLANINEQTHHTCFSCTSVFKLNYLFFFLFIGRPLELLKNEELRWFAGIVLGFTLLIALGIGPMYGGFLQGLRHAFFNVASITSTTGFCTVDFNTWPEFTKWIIILLMFCGACAGSTGGGLKVSRVAILLKSAACEVRQTLHPRSVNRVRIDGKPLSDSSVHTVLVFFVLYICLFLLFAFIVSFDGFDVTTTFTAALTCISNVGPGLNLVGPTGSFSIFSPLSKIVLSFAMLLGRLEIYPLLLLLSKNTWRR